MEEHFNLAQEGIRTSKELILLWKTDDGRVPTGTFEWLKAGSWFSGHHHLRAPARMFDGHRVSRFLLH